MNFGVLYGLSPFGIRQQTGFSAEEGKAFIDTYFTNYPGIRGYIEGIKEQVKQDGYVETLMGPAAAYQRGSLEQFSHAGGGRAHGGEHADTGYGGGHRQDCDD